MPDSDLTEAFVAKVDAFAASLEPEEQVMLIELLTRDDDVAGFGAGPWWPGLINLGIGQVASTASTNPTGLLAHEVTHVIQQRGGQPKG